MVKYFIKNNKKCKFLNRSYLKNTKMPILNNTKFFRGRRNIKLFWLKEGGGQNPHKIFVKYDVFSKNYFYLLIISKISKCIL
jgi:hypothetical protein